MKDEILYHHETTLVRRLILAPGEATHWHRDVCERVSVVLSGNALEIEFPDGSTFERIAIAAGQVDWDIPSERINRAVNVGAVPYEEVTVFFFDHPAEIPQPEAR
jgi:hypothetical protein